MNQIKVAVRIKPISSNDECLTKVGDKAKIKFGKNKESKLFTFDHVFSKTNKQTDIYDEAVEPLLGLLFKGYNATVMVYGQTGSGKTYSMGSAFTQNTDNVNIGIIPRVLDDLFKRIDESKDVCFNVKVSFVEIYKEEMRDLFGPKKTKLLKIMKENENKIQIVNLTELTVANSKDARELLEKGSAKRLTASSSLNDKSSSGHGIFQIFLESDNRLIKSKFNFVDLSGCGRKHKKNSTREEKDLVFKESVNINLGLLALTKVINILSENKSKYIPYRDCLLTRFLQDSLGGNSQTLMIACVNPANSYKRTTLNILRYADLARKIKNNPIVNIDPQIVELKNLRQQVQDLERQIADLKKLHSSDKLIEEISNPPLNLLTPTVPSILPPPKKKLKTSKIKS